MHLSLPEDTGPRDRPLAFVRVPGSKSITNRVLLLAALAPGASRLTGGLASEDTRWMREALTRLGLPVAVDGGTWTVTGGARPEASAPLWLGASGTSLRFLLPWLALCAQGSVRLEGDPRLFERPLEPLLAPLQSLGARWEPEAAGGWIHPVPTPPAGLDLEVDARLSSQFLTGLALAAAAVTGRPLRLGPLDPEDAQGDRALLAILGRAGLGHAWAGPQLLEARGALATGLDADLTDCPDLGPVLAATAALAPGPSELRGLHTLPLKECDRLEASAELVRWLGGTAEVVGDHTLRVIPGPPREGRAPFDPRNDHRMAFAAAVGGLRRGGRLADPGCVAKTFPEFWEVWRGMLTC